MASTEIPSPKSPEHSTFKDILARLVKTLEYFTTADLRTALHILFTQPTSRNTLVPDAQIGAFLTALHIHRIERKPEFLAAAAQILRKRAVKADVLERNDDFIVDIVGTGGDGYNLFNVSTTAAIVAAGAGARVIKHGSRASTSSSGSADLLQALGCTFTAPPPPSPNSTSPSAIPIPRIPFTFILAPHYHPSLALLAPIRKSLPFRTMFNVLGPLINPARPHGMVLGVAEPELGYTFAQSLRESGTVECALVVCGHEKLDEISCAGPTSAWELSANGEITEHTLQPSDFGLDPHPLSTVTGGSASENTEMFTTLLRSGNGIPGEMIPVLDFVAMNAATLLVVAGIAKDYVEGVRLAKESITSGDAWNVFETFWAASCNT